MDIPFVHNLEAQVAGRYESFSDAGDVAKPKVAMAWDVIDGLRFRGSWAQGFKAPNLEQVNATLVTRRPRRHPAGLRRPGHGRAPLGQPGTEARRVGNLGRGRGL